MRKTSILIVVHLCLSCSKKDTIKEEDELTVEEKVLTSLCSNAGGALDGLQAHVFCQLKM